MGNERSLERIEERVHGRFETHSPLHPVRSGVFYPKCALPMAHRLLGSSPPSSFRED